MTYRSVGVFCIVKGVFDRLPSGAMHSESWSLALPGQCVGFVGNGVVAIGFCVGAYVPRNDSTFVTVYTSPSARMK